jgi:quercetin dioxygenase-like cupin family protein
MKVIRMNTAESCEPEKGWKRIRLCGEPEISIEHFVKPAQHASPVHHHENLQILVVLQGTLVIKTDVDGEQTLNEGDCAFLSSNEPHSVLNPSNEPAAGLDIFVPGRSFDFWLDRIGNRPLTDPERTSRQVSPGSS